MRSIINYFTTTFTHLLSCKMTTIDKCMLFCYFGSIIKYLTCAYKNIIINYLKNPQSIPLLYLYIQNSCNGHYRVYTFGSFPFSHICVLHPSRGTLSIQFVFFRFFLILGASLSIASRRHDLSCDNPSATQYDEPLRYTKPVAFCFIPEYARRILISFI